MRSFSIFNKNLKTVSRNISYFFVLLICPVILILVAGAMLNSFDTNHIYIGVYDSIGDNCDSYREISQSQDLSNYHNTFGRIYCYSTLKECMEAVGGSKVGACLNVIEHEKYYEIDVYLDSSRRLVEYYSKQMILEGFLGSQTSFVEQTSEEMEEKLILYSLALVDARDDLYSTYYDLEEQETLLINRRQSLNQIRQDFDEIYYPIKDAEPDLIQIRNELNANNNNLQSSINDFQQRKDNLENSITNLKTFLQTRLGYDDYNYVEGELNDMLYDIEQIDIALDNIIAIQQSYELVEKIDLVLDVIPKLDNIHASLEQTDEDLASAIQKTQESKIKVQGYIDNLEIVTEDLEDLSEKVGTKTARLNFKEYFSLSNDPVLVSFPLLVAIIITFTSLILSNLFVLRQVNQPSYSREIISPTKDSSFLLADYFINLFFVAIQAVVLFIVGISWIGVPFDSIYAFTLGIFLTSSLFIFIGMSIGYLIKSQSLSMLLTIFLVMLLFIVSELLVPTPLISPTMRFFIELNPFIILTAILKTTLVLERPMSETSWRFIVLGFFLFFSMVFAYISRKINKTRLRE